MATATHQNLIVKDVRLIAKIGISLSTSLLTLLLASWGMVTPTLATAATALATYPVPGTQGFCTTPLFSEVPSSLKCVQVPQPFVLDAKGNPTPAKFFRKDASGAFISPPVLIPPGSNPNVNPPINTTTDPNFTKTSTIPSLIKNQAAAIALGKALFWDNQVGSDGLACASCHYSAGADPGRVQNQINPGLRNASGEVASDGVTPIGNVFNFEAGNPSGLNPLLPAKGKGPNYTLTKSDFPFTKYREPTSFKQPDNIYPPQMHRNDPDAFLSDGITPNPNYGKSMVTSDSDDIVSSAGVYHSTFNNLSPDGTKDKCKRRFPTSGPDMPLFNVGGIGVRQVEPRNAPTVVNAVFNFRNFWDGRANNVFNGLDPFGNRRPFPMPWTDTTQAPPTDINTWDGKKFTAVKIRIYNASLASQAVGPALSDFEMSCGGKQFPTLGRKMLTVLPLNGQIVNKNDSVLGSYKSITDPKGLNTTYKAMIQAAFVDNLWNAPATQLLGVQTTVKGSGYTQMENNFSLFWGLAIQAYEATLVSDDSPFDQAQEGRAAATNPLTDPSSPEFRGKNLFNGKGKCISCHSGPEFTAASVTHVQGKMGIGSYLQRMLMGDGGVALYDVGFYNIGVRPAKEDVGVGATDPYGYPLSFTRNAKKSSNGYNISPLGVDPFNTNSVFFDPAQPNLNPVDSYERDAVDGAFKTPTLRNVELTGPYFHNGGSASLEQVVQFYNRGGDRRDNFMLKLDTSTYTFVLVDAVTNQTVPTDPWTGLPVQIDPATNMPKIDPVTGMTLTRPLDSTGYLNTTGYGWSSNLAPDMAGARDRSLMESGFLPESNLSLTSQDVADLVAYMKMLTDERVRWETAPFDHPQLGIPNGHPTNELTVTPRNANTTIAVQNMMNYPAVPADGRASKVTPLPAVQSFESLLK